MKDFPCVLAEYPESRGVTEASHKVTALPGEPWMCRGGVGPSGCSVLALLQGEAAGSVLVDPSPCPRWLKPKVREGRQAGGLQFVFCTWSQDSASKFRYIPNSVLLEPIQANCFLKKNGNI